MECDIRVQHLFLRKTWGWFTCRSLGKLHTTHYAFKPRIIVPNHLSWLLIEFSFVPIKGNHTLLFAKYIENLVHFLHLSIHEIRSDSRVGPALWSFNSRVPDHWNDSHLELIKSTKNPLAITFMVWFNDHWRLFDISTATETEASNKFRLKVESGRIDVDLKIKGLKWAHDDNLGLSEIFMQCRICSNVFSKSSYPLTSAFF